MAKFFEKLTKVFIAICMSAAMIITFVVVSPFLFIYLIYEIVFGGEQ